MKDEQNCSNNGGGDAYLLKIWSDFSSIQYLKIQMPENDNTDFKMDLL